MSTKESIERLDAAVRALGDINLAEWSDATLRGHLEELSDVLCRVDGHLARLAESVRARGFIVAEAADDDGGAMTLAA